tara:strand:+ start:124 stop:258 length:135 start_codon:yes stop_codon:yes gene_type:complete
MMPEYKYAREIPRKYPKKIPEVVLTVNPNKPIVLCWSNTNLREI